MKSWFPSYPKVGFKRPILLLMPLVSDWLLWIFGSKNKVKNKIIVEPVRWWVLGTTAPEHRKNFCQDATPVRHLMLLLCTVMLNLINDFLFKRVINCNNFLLMYFANALDSLQMPK